MRATICVVICRPVASTAMGLALAILGCEGGGAELIAPLDPLEVPQPGHDQGRCTVPETAGEEDVSDPDVTIGSGTPQSCSADAVIEAVAQGGIITFDCGDDPITITLDRTAKIFNDRAPKTVIDGGGKVTLSGDGKVRILYQNTCDRDQVWTTTRCQNQEYPHLVVQNLTLVDGNAQGQDPRGGGAIFVRGGQFKLINTRFFRNRCDVDGPDVGGGAVRVLDLFEDRPAYVVHSTFGGNDGLGNACANGGGLSSIGVSYIVINSLFAHNRATGNGANPARPGTPGGGSGGAIYVDGRTFSLQVCGTSIADNDAREGGGAIFFVSNDRTGTLTIRDSILRRNHSGGFETRGFPGIFVLADGDPDVVNSVVE